MRKLMIAAAIIIAALIVVNIAIFLLCLAYEGISIVIDDIQDLKQKWRHDNKC